MRCIFGILLIVAWLGWMACRVETVSHASAIRPKPEDGWRRTVGGWERHVTLPVTRSGVEPTSLWRSHPHPLVFTLLLFLLSALLLVAFTDSPAFTLSDEPRSPAES